MEKENASTISNVTEDAKELNTNEDAVSRADTLKPR